MPPPYPDPPAAAAAPPTAPASASPHAVGGSPPPPRFLLRAVPLPSALSDADRFFAESPPPPPRHGRPTCVDDEAVPETPDPAPRGTDPPPAWRISPGAGCFGLPTLRSCVGELLLPAQPLLCAVPRSTTAAALSPLKRQGNDALTPGGRIGSPALEPGWTPAKRRRRTIRRSPPPRHDGRQDRRRNAPSSRPATSLQAFITATKGRCFNCLGRDHRASQ
jgi:hypothetical protein